MFTNIFAVIALAMSAFFGFMACRIFGVAWPDSWAGRLYQFWFNFTGSIVGWLALAIEVKRVLPQLETDAAPILSWVDAVLSLIAFGGVTGHLPMATMGIFVSTSRAAAALLKKWFGSAA